MMPFVKALLVPILLMPGGFVLAAALWLLQRRRSRSRQAAALTAHTAPGEPLDATS